MLIYPKKYCYNGNDYDTERYWKDRLANYGLKSTGSGDEGLTEEDNIKRYKKDIEKFDQIFSSKIKPDHKILEVGVGNGVYTNYLQDNNYKNVTGIDITDTLFDLHNSNFRNYTFLKRDITKDKLKSNFDAILCIDVIEHIIAHKKLHNAIRNMYDALNDNGYLFLTPIYPTRKKDLFYVKHWTLPDIISLLPSNSTYELIDYRYNSMMIFKKGITKRAHRYETAKRLKPQAVS